MRILIQFIGQAIGVILLRKRKGTLHLPYKMPLYPMPVIIVVAMWAFIFFSTGPAFMLSGLAVILLGLAVYLVKAGSAREWPFSQL